MTVRKIKTDQLVKIKNNICMPRGDSFSEYPTYIKHWEEARPWGWEIRILTQSGLHTIHCKWKNYRRAHDLRDERNSRTNKQRKSKSRTQTLAQES